MSFICLTVRSDRRHGTPGNDHPPMAHGGAGMLCGQAGRVRDLGQEGGAEEALTWVEDLHGGVGVWMLFMDHLSADLLRKNLPGDRHRI